MKRRETVRVNFEFPSEDYPNLKFLCAKRRTTLRAMLTEILLREIEKAEEEEFAKECKRRVETAKEEDLIDWDEAKKLAGW